MKKLSLLALAVSVACTTGRGSSQKAPAPAGSRYQEAAPAAQTATAPAAPPGADVVEETAADYVVRYKKSQVQRVDATHVKLPMIPHAFTIDHEDADYVYIRYQKITPEERSAYLAQELQKKKEKYQEALAETMAASPAPRKTLADALEVSAADFAAVTPKIAAAGVSFVEAGRGLPTRGQWRQNFDIADVNGDGIPDIVAAPPRLGARATFQVFLGDGKGDFRPQPVVLLAPDGSPAAGKMDYGSVAVADFDGDGKADVAMAIHGQGVRVFLQRENFRFVEASSGLPKKYSSQAISAFDVNGDGRPDLVVSQDVPAVGYEGGEGPARQQVRVFLNQGGNPVSWKFDPDAIAGGCFSFDVRPMRLNGPPGSPARDLLTGCRALGGWGLAWDNDGKGHFSNVHELFTGVEQFAYHNSVAPGTFGRDRDPAYADFFFKNAGGMSACGVNVYYKRDGAWHKVVIWRDPKKTTLRGAVAMGDLNGDGLDDVILATYEEPRVRIFYQTPAGGFEESPADREPKLRSPAVYIRIADLNGDGRPDIVLGETVYSERPTDPGGLQVLLNEGK